MHCGSWLQPHALTSCQVTPQNAGSGCQQACQLSSPLLPCSKRPQQSVTWCRGGGSSWSCSWCSCSAYTELLA